MFINQNFIINKKCVPLDSKSKLNSFQNKTFECKNIINPSLISMFNRYTL